MAVADNPAPQNRDWKKGESFSSALIQIVIVGVILAAAVYFFVQRGTRRKEIADRLREAKVLALRDNPRDLAKAQAELEEIFKLDSDARDALALAADIETERWVFHRIDGAEQKARDFLRKAEQAESRSEERFANKAIQMLAEGKPADAEKYAEDLRRQGASSAKLWYAIAQAHHLQGHLALARQAYSQATDKAWKNPRYFAGYGEALLDQADYRTAMEVLSKGLQANPDHIRVQLNLALVRIYRGAQVKDAADAIDAALEQDLTPGLKARALAAKAEYANFENRHDDAINLANEALQVNPSERFALFAKARALALKKDAGALDAFRAAAAQNKVAPVVYFTGAHLLQENGNIEAATALLDDYAQVYSRVEVVDAEGKTQPALDRDDRYWIARGDVLRASGKMDEAMTAYDRAVAADSVNRTRAYYAKGQLHLDRKEYDKALEHLALITPEDGTGQIPEAYQAKGQVLFAKKEFALGCQEFAFALARMRQQQAPREKMNAVLDDVTKQLIANGQRNMAKLWQNEAKPLIQ